jgi:putative ABC transport system permease protein
MALLRNLASGLRSLFRRERVDRELDEELNGFLEMAAEEKMKEGISRKEALRAVRLERGSPEVTKEVVRSAGWESFVETLWQDLRFGVRTLRKNPAFTAIVILTLALGIGANTAIFSVVYTVLLKALPYPQADRLVMVYENVHLANYQNRRNTPSPGNFSDWMAQNTIFEGMAAYSNRSFNVTGTGEPLRVEGERASAGFFSTLQVNAALGRIFTPEEDRPGRSHVVVIGDGLWRSLFASDLRILGQKIFLDDEGYQIVGVMPPGFHFPDPDDQLWVPLALTPDELISRDSHFLDVFARLKPGVNLAQAQTEMNLIALRLTQLYPQSNTGQTVDLVPLHEDIVGSVRPALLVLVGAVGLVLLIVCANVANLLLARASVRHREIAVRVALGAGRARVARQLLTESVLLALLGCAIGVLLAHWGLGALKILAATNLPRTEEFSLSAPVLLFSLAISLVAGLIFGVSPAFQAVRGNVQDTLKSGSRESAAVSRLRTRSLLVILETGLGFVVVIGAGLLVRGFLRIEQVQLGFQPEGVLTFRVIPRGERYSQSAQRAVFYQQAIERLQALPGVQSAAAITFIPLTLAKGRKGFTIEGRAPSGPGQIPLASYDIVTPEYFKTMRVPLIEGRDFSWSDSPQTQPVVIVNEAMAKRYWPGEDPLGKRFHQAGPDDKFPWITIVGVVANVREFSPTVEPEPTMYFPIAQFTYADGILRDWVVRTNGDPARVGSSVRSAIRQVDKNLPITRIRTMEDVRSLSLASQRMHLLLFGLFGALALALASVGIYGVLAYNVAQRTREIGIRLALGADGKAVLLLVVGEGIRLAALGILLGVIGALALTRLMSGMIYGISSTDPATFFAVAALLGFVAVAACYIPARRAMRVDPMVALRYE